MTVPQRRRSIIDRLFSDQDGQGLAEYALILALIALIVIVALVFMGTQLSTELDVIGKHVESVAS